MLKKNKVGMQNSKAEINAELKLQRREAAALEKKIAKLENAGNAETGNGEVLTTDAFQHVPQERKLQKDDYIPVMSLCPHTLVLSTRPSGESGKQFTFRKMGEIKKIQYEDVVDILEVMRTFADSGVFYILEPQVVYTHGLVETYNKILTNEGINKVLTADADTAFELFKTANERQQRTISEILVRKLLVNEEENPIDMNFVYMVERHLGIDIIKKAEASEGHKALILKN